MTISIIAAIAANRALGRDNNLIYKLPDDLKRFKELTLHHTVIMGRKTFDSLPRRPLPNRKNIIISRQFDVKDMIDTYFVKSIDEALELCDENEEVFIIGGASIYAQFIKRGIVDKLYMTEVNDIPEKADVYFPEIPDDFDVEYAECHSKDENHKFEFNFVNYIRK